MSRNFRQILLAAVMLIAMLSISAFADFTAPEYDSREMTAAELEEFFDAGNTQYKGDVIGALYDALETPDEVFGMVYTAKEDYNTASSGPYANYIVDFELTSKTDVSVLLVGNYGSYGTIPVGIVNLEANEPINVMETASTINGLSAWARFTYADIVLLVNEFKCVAIPLTEDVLRAYNEVALTGEYDEETVLAALLAEANPLGEESFTKAEEIVSLSLGLDLYETEMVSGKPVKTGVKHNVGTKAEFEAVVSLPEYDSREMTDAELEEFFNAGNTQYKGDVIDALYDALDNPDEVFGMVYTAKEDYDAASASPFANYIVDFELTSKTDVSVLLVGNYGSYGTIPVGIVNLEANTPVNIMETAATIPGLSAWARFTYADIVLLVNEFKCAAIPLTEDVLKAYNEVALTGEYDEEAVLAALLANANPLGEESFTKAEEIVSLSLGLDLYETEMVSGKPVKTGVKHNVGTKAEFEAVVSLPEYDSREMTDAELEEFFNAGNTQYKGDVINALYDALDNPDEVFGMVYTAKEDYNTASSGPFANYIVDFELTSKTDVSVLLVGNYGSYGTIPVGIVNLEANTPVNIMETAATIPGLSAWARFTYADIVLLVGEFKCAAIPLTEDVLRAYHEIAFTGEYDEETVLAALLANANPLGEESFVKTTNSAILSLGIDLYETEIEDGALVKTGEKFDIGTDVEAIIYATVPPVSSTHTDVEEIDNAIAGVVLNGDIRNVYNKLDAKDTSIYSVTYETVETAEEAAAAPYANHKIDFEITSSKKTTVYLALSAKKGASAYSFRSTGDIYTTIPLGIVTLEENTPVKVLELASQIYNEELFDITYAELVAAGNFTCIAIPLSNDLLNAYYKNLCEEDHDFAEANPTYNKDAALEALVNDTVMNPLGITELVPAEEGLTLGLDLNLYDDDNSWTVEDSEEYEHEEVAEATLMQKLLIVNNMEAKEGYNRIDVCAAVDSLSYSEVGFKVTVVDMSGEYLTQSSTLKTTTVYRNMTVENAEGVLTTYTSAQLGGEYIFGCEILLNEGVYTNANTKVIITPYAIDLEGNEIAGKQVTLTDTAIKNKMPGSALFRD